MRAAQVMVPEMKCELDLYEYVLVHTSMYFLTQVCTKYVLFYQSTYLVYTSMYSVYKNIAGQGDAFLCRMKVGNITVCMTCMLWCSNTKSVPLLVSNIHDIILVRTT